MHSVLILESHIAYVQRCVIRLTISGKLGKPAEGLLFGGTCKHAPVSLQLGSWAGVRECRRRVPIGTLRAAAKVSLVSISPSAKAAS